MDPREIKRAMDELTQGETTYRSVERLALLKIAHDHLTAEPQNIEKRAQEYSWAQPSQPTVMGSEFVTLFYDIPVERAVRVLDEHMSALKIVFPREYDAVMRKLWNEK